MADSSASFLSCPEHGEEAYMQSFIRSHMMNILTPVADHVHELQIQLGQLRQDLKTADGNIGEFKRISDEKCEKLATMENRFYPVHLQIEKLEAEIAMSNREQARMQTEHRLTKSDVRKTAESLLSSDAAIKTLQHNVQSLDSSIESAQAQSKRCSKETLEMRDSFTRLDGMCEGLNQRHFDLVKEWTDSARTGAETRQALKEFMYDVQSQNEFAGGHGHINNDGIEKRLVEIENAFRVDNDEKGKGLKETNVRLLRIEAALDQADDGCPRIFETMGKTQEEVSKQIKDCKDYAATIECGLSVLNSKLETEWVHVFSLTGELERHCKAQSAQIDNVLEEQHNQATQIRKTMHNLTEHDGMQKRLDNQLVNFAKEVEQLTHRQNDEYTKNHYHAALLQQTKIEVDCASAELEKAKSEREHIRDDQAHLQVSNTRLSNRFEACSRSIQGLSKGFQDTERHVLHGECGMLPPKDWKAKALPDVFSKTLQRPETASTAAGQHLRPYSAQTVGSAGGISQASR